jgi:anaerobic magnesium-protoporphyrin IX monomethyl ester cyclase
MRKLKVVLLRPQRVYKKYNKALKPAPPLGLAILASVLKEQGHEVVIIDSIVEKIDQEEIIYGDIMLNGMSHHEIIDRIPQDADIVGVSCMFTVDWLGTRDLINLIGVARPNSKLIAGGEHVTALPDLCFQQCPSLQICALGEGEETMIDICRYVCDEITIHDVKGILYRGGDNLIYKTSKRERIRTLDNLPIPAWELFPVKSYFENKLNFGVGGKRTLPILTTRGCPYICSFCSSPLMWGTRYFMRSVNNVVDEIEHLVNVYKVENIDFYDLTAIINSRWIIELSKEILRRNLKITWQLPSGTRSEAITPEVLHYMKLSGCTVVTYAPENGSSRILKLIHKKVNLNKMLQSVSESNQVGIYVKLNIILGFPQETHSDILKTIWFIIRSSWNGAYDMGPNPFYPIPGTELFNTLLKEKVIDIYNNSYYESLLDADNLWKIKFYNEHISTTTLKVYFLSYIAIFYVTNFLFRPHRFFITLRNVLTLNAQTRGQYVLQRILEQNRFLKLLNTRN